MRISQRTLTLLCGVALVGLGAGCGGPGSGEDAGTCEVGTLGCGCVADRCGKHTNGEQLLCMGGTCDLMACPSGERGCTCRRGESCNAPGDSCTNGFCLAADCTPGQQACGCLAGTCDVGLTCIESTVCVDSKGYEGGACLDTGRCHRGNRCDASTNRCVYCDPGTAGCQCNGNNACNGGLTCAAGQCLPASMLPPANPVCYSPCRADLVVDGGRVQCGPDDLLRGCLPGQACVSGSCLGAGETKPSCASDLQCPFFQVCLQGGCYSNCDVNADCASGMGCYKHACRPSCVVAQGQAACPTGTACTADDGQNGYCTPVGTSTQAASTLPAGGLVLPVRNLELSNVKQTGEVIVVPRSDITQDVTVRKLWHQVSYADGTTERVDAPVSGQGGYRVCNPAANECPLWWLKLGGAGAMPTQDPVVSFRLPPNCFDDVTGAADGGAAQRCPRVRVEGAGAVTAVRWEGALEISSGDSRAEVRLSYVERPEGQWTGSMYYFGTFKRTGMDAWIASQDSQKQNVMNVENGLIQRWGALRGGSLEGWSEFLAVLTATRTESWKFGTVKDRCRASTGGSLTSACYPYASPTSTAGIRVYVQNTNAAPIPSGVSELPVALNLRIDPGNPQRFEGRVESSMAMHYPGNPAIKLEFAGNPAEAAACVMAGGSDCMVFLRGQAHVTPDVNRLVSTVGGRFISADGTCPTGFAAVSVPWLVPGFTAQTTPGANGQRDRVECRDLQLPFDTVVNADLAKVNLGLAGGNPVPDGNPRERTLRFIDGALVNQSELFILFEESYASFIPGQAPTTAYGFMRLKRAAADLAANAYVGLPTTTAMRTPIQPGAKCSAGLLTKLGKDSSFNLATASSVELTDVVGRLLNGTAGAATHVAVANPGAQVHYWCEDTGLFNGGPGDRGQPGDVRVECPAGSKVVFFYTGFSGTGTNRTAAQMAAEACQTNVGPDGRARCFDTLELWRLGGAVVTEFDPTYTCTDTNQVYCSDNRLDLRAGKSFFYRTAVTTATNMVGLQPLIDSAFRYKTRFRSTTGGSLGFAPRQCIPGADSVPYCYDPKEIEEARERIDCLLDLYTRADIVAGTSPRLPNTPTPLRDRLLTLLRANFSQFNQTFEGFERLYAELLIMQGDEALTAAYASRFDLAATGGAAFRGSAFELNGIDLTGVAGAEMYRLYEATQYYQLSLDRLYLLGENMRVALSRGAVGSANNFISAETVTMYLERLVRAAAQKSRSWAEVARRYQNFNRPDLARAVIERAYVTTYLESALISRVMLDIAQNSPPSQQDQIRVTIEKAQRSYRMALLDMREVYQQITDEVNFFGYPAEYIPFPALDSSSVSSANAYESLSTLARQRLDLARTREQTALSSARQGRVDAVQFQGDLTSIRNTYENQLAAACGNFKGVDGRVYPAIRKYAHQDQRATLMGDPCGRLGNGEIHNAMANVKDTQLRLQGVLLRHRNILEDIEVERQRVADVCGLMNQQVEFTYQRQQDVISVQDEMTRSRALATFIMGSVAAVISSIEVLDCEIQCASSAAMAATVAATGIAAAGAQYATELRIATAEKELKEFEANTVRFSSSFTCAGGALPDGGTSNTGILQVESQARVASMLNDTLEVKVEALRAEYALRVAMAEVQRMFSNAQRVQAQQEEAEQLAIDVQQAQNDPNVRIYQNDAVLNADVSFRDALATAYRLTRVFEYYTSQSYAKKEQLYLIRMIQAGQYNLENYLLELDNEFIAFEEQFGNPDVRVLVLSLRDDILRIPYVKNTGEPLDEGARIGLLREKLKDVKLLDSRGYLTLPFSTDVKSLSPVTRNHKVRHVEIDLQGVKMGDSLARVYLRMAGTGVVRNVSDDLDYYVFPERLAVVNASLLGAKVFDPEVYRNYRFRDRPLVNTLWELVVNQRDELVNKDIDLQSLTDVRILIYYSDFTTF